MRRCFSHHPFERIFVILQRRHQKFNPLSIFRGCSALCHRGILMIRLTHTTLPESMFDYELLISSIVLVFSTVWPCLETLTCSTTCVNPQRVLPTCVLRSFLAASFKLLVCSMLCFENIQVSKAHLSKHHSTVSMATRLPAIWDESLSFFFLLTSFASLRVHLRWNKSLFYASNPLHPSCRWYLSWPQKGLSQSALVYRLVWPPFMCGAQARGRDGFDSRTRNTFLPPAVWACQSHWRMACFERKPSLWKFRFNFVFPVDMVRIKCSSPWDPWRRRYLVKFGHQS